MSTTMPTASAFTKEYNVFAILAAIVFLLALFGVHIGTINMVTLGLLFIACHFVFDWRPWTGYVRRP